MSNFIIISNFIKISNFITMEKRWSLNKHFKGVPCAGCSSKYKETTR